jgi:hypothetical protein
MGLSGRIPENVLGNLTRLHTLSLRFNALTGSVPSDISSINGIRNLYFQDNLFSGPIPEFLYSLPNLVRLNLASNNFSGEISGSFNNLTRLATLYLENNQLTGSIPDLTRPGLVQVNFSGNHLTGSIPRPFSSQPASAFDGNSLCGPPLRPCNGTSSSSSRGLSGGAIAGIVIGSVLALLIIIFLLICLCRRRKGNKTGNERELTAVKVENPEEKSAETSNSVSSGFAAQPSSAIFKDKTEAKAAGGGKHLIFFAKSNRGFDLEDLLRASAEVLGKGTFGTAYKAVLETGSVVAVKRLKDVTLPEKEFREKIEGVGAMDHESLVPLRAYYFSGDEKLLVYDYMSMGSLSALLHGNRGAGRTPLNWETRSGIALGAARGIAYLHSQGPQISHGNIKSSNILLTSNYAARVSDFGLAQLVGPAGAPTRVAGYRAPEVTDPRKVSQKADVYSFGVLLLELLTGKAPTHALLNEEGVDLPRWVQSVVREEWTVEVFDLELLRYQNVEEDMVQLLQLAIDCTAQYPDKRPTMSDVVSQIEELCRSTLQRDLQNEVVDPDEQLARSVDSGPPIDD